MWRQVLSGEDRFHGKNQGIFGIDVIFWRRRGNNLSFPPYIWEPGTVIGILSHLIFPTPVGNNYSHTHFADEEVEPQEAVEFSQTHPIYKCPWFLETELLFLPHCQTCEREHEPYLFKLQGILTSMGQLRAIAGFIIKKADKRGECSMKERKGARKSSRSLE